MRIRELAAEGWRNLAPLALAPGERLSVLYGDNGQGKTNVLEAAYYLAALRSFRTSHAEDLIRREAPHGAGAAAGATSFTAVSNGGSKSTCRRPAGSRALDGKVVRGTAAALGTVSVVLFVPEDLLLPRAAPAARRRFLDLAIFNVERGYYAEASAFQKVLRSRNALLRRGSPDSVLLDTYDDQLARDGRQGRHAAADLGRRARAAIGRRTFGRCTAGSRSGSRYRSDPAIDEAADEPAVEAALRDGLLAPAFPGRAAAFHRIRPPHRRPRDLPRGRPGREATLRRGSSARWCWRSSLPS